MHVNATEAQHYTLIMYIYMYKYIVLRKIKLFPSSPNKSFPK